MGLSSYSLKEGEKTEEFHRNRRIFYIHKGQVVIADSNFPYSHLIWFKQLGLVNEEEESFMETATRGMVCPNGNLHFYRGYDFNITAEIEEEFFHNLEKIASILNLPPETNIFGGINPETKEPRKKYGTIKEFLS